MEAEIRSTLAEKGRSFSSFGISGRLAGGQRCRRLPAACPMPLGPFVVDFLGVHTIRLLLRALFHTSCCLPANTLA